MGKGVQIGLNSLYYAKLISDDTTGASYETPKLLAPAIKAKITTKTAVDVLYADDGASETASSIGETELELQIKDLDLDTQAALLGHTVTGGVLIQSTTDTPPYVAIGFKSKKSNGKYRYVWLYKGKFTVPDQESETTSDKTTFQTPTIKGTFIRRDYDNNYQKKTDEDHADYVSSIGTNWFLDVNGTPDTTAPTISSVVPAANATGVAATSTVVWTFSEAIRVSDVIAANFFLQKADGSAQVAGTLTVNAAHTAVTFTPSSNLAATTQYMAVVTVGVHDLAGNALAATNVTKFTTA